MFVIETIVVLDKPTRTEPTSSVSSVIRSSSGKSLA